MTEVFIVCPGRTTSGGPELCHQLADTLNRDQAGRASVVYWPFSRRFTTAESYSGYDARPALREDITAGSVVVLPETYGSLLEEFPGCDVYYWWMSVNNFYREAGVEVADRLAKIRRLVSVNLYQSEYARMFCAANRLTHAQRLGDRLAPIYLEAIKHPRSGPRRNIVAYNPAKGLARTAAVLRALDSGWRVAPKVVALQGLSPSQVATVLSTVKVYVDFGEHPGKDRLPREAAALGACVVTNQRGSAGNAVDVPIPDEFKVDDRRHGFERRAADKIHHLIDDFDNQAPRFDGYRAAIAAEAARFTADARATFRSKVAL
jgi:hypothetical protein